MEPNPNRTPTTFHPNDLKSQRERKVGQIRALKYVHGYVGKQLAIEQEELKIIEHKLNSSNQEEL